MNWLALTAAPTAEAIREKAQDVFSRPEFDPAKPPGIPAWLRWLAGFFQGLGGLSGTAPVLFWVLVVGLTVILVALLVHIGYTVYKTLTFSERTTAASAKRAARLRRSADHAETARRAAAAGDFTEAIRHLFLALVFRYDEAGRVTLRPAVTNREYLGLLDDRLPVRRELGVFVDTLDDYWYAQRPAGEAQYERCLNLYQQLTA